jgi:hypothetical protein
MRSLGLALVLAVGLVAGWGARAGAEAIDSVAEHIVQLERGGDYKVRLSAAVQLAKSEDPRATEAMLRVLENENSKTLRRLAALSLGTMVTADTPAKLRGQVERALTHAAENDADRKVRRHAQRSLETLAEIPARPDTGKNTGAGQTTRTPTTLAPPRGGRGVFLHVSAPRDASKRAPKGLTPQLHDAVRAMLRKKMPEYRLDWPSQSLPTASELTQAHMRAYRVQPSVMALRIDARGSQAEVECTVSLQVNPWQGSDSAERWSEQQAASATGRGRVRGANQKDAIAAAQRDCVVTVAERITSEQVVPFLRRLEAAKD